MKQIATAFLLCALATTSLQAGDQSAIVRAIRGGLVELHRPGPGTDWTPAKPGSALGKESQIRTGPSSTVDLSLAGNGQTIRLAEDSILKFKTLESSSAPIAPTTKTVLELPKGRMLINVKALAEGSSCVINTPNFTFELNSGEFEGSADGSLAVQTGQAIVRAGNDTFVVKAGERFDAATKQVVKDDRKPHPSLSTQSPQK